ncbi:MAG: hypothetical protein ACT4PV_15490 [Planctomycetaceae bacterium]
MGRGASSRRSCVVLENWTWHGPTEDRVVVELEAGERAFLLEHFELDGWAALAFDLRPVRGGPASGAPLQGRGAGERGAGRSG